MLSAVAALHARESRNQLAAVSPVGRAAGLEPLELRADPHAADGLYERHAPRVFAYCLSKLGRREDAEDAVQTTFLHAVRGLRRGVVPSIELAWLLGIARNVCLSRFESAGRRGRLELVCDPVDLERNPAPQGRRDELFGLDEALAQLPEQQRQAVLLRDWRGLSYEEVAAQLGVSLANAETLIFRGRRTLAELLQEEPSAVRRRLGAAGNLGSLASAIKTALTGTAAATKITAAVAVVAVSGAGVAAGTGAVGVDRSSNTAPVASKSRANTPVVVAVQDARAIAAGQPANATIVAAPRPAIERGSTTAEPATAERAKTTPAATPTSGSASSPSASPNTRSGTTPAAPNSASPIAAVRVPAVTVPALENVVPATTETVQSTVDQIAPALPVETPQLPDAIGSLPVPAPPPPLVETVVESVPPVTVAVPAVGPVTVDPPQLLP